MSVGPTSPSQPGEPSESSEGPATPGDKKLKKEFQLPGRKGREEKKSRYQKEIEREVENGKGNVYDMSAQTKSTPPKIKRSAFQLPKKKGKKEEKKESPSLSPASVGEKVLGKGVERGAEQIEAAREASSVQQTQPITRIAELIQKMVSGMVTDGKSFTSMKLSEGADVPPAFAGSTVSLNFQENGLVIKFDHFMSPQQERDALFLVDQNKEQLQQLVQALEAKNIQVAALQLGVHTISFEKEDPFGSLHTFLAGEGGEESKERRVEKIDKDDEGAP